MEPLDVLVVEDSPEYLELVTSVLQGAGHHVRCATTIADALEAFYSAAPDLLVLDLTLPDGEGLGLCQAIRARSNPYVLMLTARDHELDKIIGFRQGADDYVTKPFSPRELAARVNAVARRLGSSKPEEAPARVFGGLSVRPDSREVAVDGTPVELTKLEFDLLDVLSGEPDRVFSREQLIERVWGADWYGDARVVNVHVANMRKKLAARADREIVRTVRGVGYGLAR